MTATAATSPSSSPPQHPATTPAPSAPPTAQPLSTGAAATVPGPDSEPPDTNTDTNNDDGGQTNSDTDPHAPQFQVSNPPNVDDDDLVYNTDSDHLPGAPTVTVEAHAGFVEFSWTTPAGGWGRHEGVELRPGGILDPVTGNNLGPYGMEWRIGSTGTWRRVLQNVVSNLEGPEVQLHFRPLGRNTRHDHLRARPRSQHRRQLRPMGRRIRHHIRPPRPTPATCTRPDLPTAESPTSPWLGTCLRTPAALPSRGTACGTAVPANAIVRTPLTPLTPGNCQI